MESLGNDREWVACSVCAGREVCQHTGTTECFGEGRVSLKTLAAEARERQARYPFTKTESSAKRRAQRD